MDRFVMVSRHISSTLTGLYLFTAFLVWLVGWGPWAVEGMSSLALWWCVILAMIGFAALIAAPWVDGLAQIASIVCQGLGLLGTVVGFKVALNASGVEIVELEGLDTALSTTAVGITFSVALLVQDWLLVRSADA